jgi:hypothetical protein
LKKKWKKKKKKKKQTLDHLEIFFTKKGRAKKKGKRFLGLDFCQFSAPQKSPGS